MENDDGNFVAYKVKQATLVPDKYGKHIKIKMLSAYDKHGKWLKHIKLDEDALLTLEGSWIIPEQPKRSEDV
jgi:hypothetical protein